MAFIKNKYGSTGGTGGTTFANLNTSTGSRLRPEPVPDKPIEQTGLDPFKFSTRNKTNWGINDSLFGLGTKNFSPPDMYMKENTAGSGMNGDPDAFTNYGPPAPLPAESVADRPIANVPTSSGRLTPPPPVSAKPIEPEPTMTTYGAKEGSLPPADIEPPGATSATQTQTDPYDQMYQDLLAKHEAGWQNQEDLARAEAASQQRRAAEMSAGMGAAAGGGTFASGMAQAGLKGQETMMRARQEHEVRGLELRMTHLLNQLKVAEAQKDRDSQANIQSQINNMALLIEQIRAGAYPDNIPEPGEEGYVHPDATLNELGEATSMNENSKENQFWDIFTPWKYHD